MVFNAFVRAYLYQGNRMRSLFVVCSLAAALMTFAPATLYAQEITITIKDKTFTCEYQGADTGEGKPCK